MSVGSVRSGYVMNDGNPLGYHEWGKAGAPAVVMIAPIRSPAYGWRGTAERLEDRYRVVAVNLRGHGDSGPFPVREYNPDGYIDDLNTFVGELDLAPTVILSLSVVAAGAAVGFAAKYPQRTAGLVLVEGGPGYAKEVAEAAGRRVRAMEWTFPNWDAAVSYYAKQNNQEFAPRAVVEERAPYAFRVLPDGTVTWKHDRILHELWPGDDWARNSGAHPPHVWERVQCPIVVVKGESKAHLSEAACKEITRYGKGSYWVAVPNAKSHFVQDEHPEAFVRIVRTFLDKVHRA